MALPAQGRIRGLQQPGVGFLLGSLRIRDPAPGPGDLGRGLPDLLLPLGPGLAGHHERPHAVDPPPYREHEPIRYPAPEVYAVQGRSYFSHLIILSQLISARHAELVSASLILLHNYTSVYHSFVK